MCFGCERCEAMSGFVFRSEAGCPPICTFYGTVQRQDAGEGVAQRAG
jgi:hypothetical protein